MSTKTFWLFRVEDFAFSAHNGIYCGYQKSDHGQQNADNAKRGGNLPFSFSSNTCAAGLPRTISSNPHSSHFYGSTHQIFAAVRAHLEFYGNIEFTTAGSACFCFVIIDFSAFGTYLFHRSFVPVLTLTVTLSLIGSITVFSEISASNSRKNSARRLTMVLLRLMSVCPSRPFR